MLIVYLKENTLLYRRQYGHIWANKANVRRKHKHHFKTLQYFTSSPLWSNSATIIFRDEGWPSDTGMLSTVAVWRRSYAVLTSAQTNSMNSTTVRMVTPSHRLNTPPMFDHSTSFDIAAVSLTTIGTCLLKTTLTCKKLSVMRLSWRTCFAASFYNTRNNRRVFFFWRIFGSTSVSDSVLVITICAL